MVDRARCWRSVSGSLSWWIVFSARCIQPVSTGKCASVHKSDWRPLVYLLLNIRRTCPFGNIRFQEPAEFVGVFR
jgi:hypothetical protein